MHPKAVTIAISMAWVLCVPGVLGDLTPTMTI